MDKQRSTKHYHKTKDRVTRTLLTISGELKCSGRISSSCSTNCMLSIISVTEHLFSYFLLSFFSVDNLNKTTNGTNYVGTHVARGVILYVWVYLKCKHFKQHSIQPNVTIRLNKYILLKRQQLVSLVYKK